MKRTILKLATVCAALAALGGTALAQVIPLVNPGFEQPGTGKINYGFASIPGWGNSGVTYTDSGVQGNNNHTPGGAWEAYEQTSDDGAYQMSTYQILNHDQITLTWWSENDYDGGGAPFQHVQMIATVNQTDPYSSAIVLAAQTNQVSGGWTQYTLNYTGTVATVGMYVGVQFDSGLAGGKGSSTWMDYDDFAMAVIHGGAPPVFNTVPASQTQVLGSTATFGVTTLAATSYQWQAGVVGSGVYTNLLNGGQFSGVTTTTLTVTNLQVRDGADYVCVAYNSQGSTTSAPPATLTIDTSAPTINTSPASQSVLQGSTANFSVNASGAVTYQWQAGVVGSGVYTNLSDGGQFSGSATANLSINNVQINDGADYVVVVSNGGGSVASTPPATLTVVPVLYSQTFTMLVPGDQSPAIYGWVGDCQQGSYNRVFTDNLGFSFPQGAIYTYNSGADEAYYVTTVTGNGSSIQNPIFPSIDLSSASNLVFYVSTSGGYGSLNSYFAVQMNGSDWFVNMNSPIPEYGTASAMSFDPTAANWTQLTVSGTGTLSNPNYPAFGNPASSDLSGKITGAGVVLVALGGYQDQNFYDFAISGNITPSRLPVVNVPPTGQTNYTGTTAVFSVVATTNGTTTGLTYQWKAGIVGSGVYANLSNGGQFSGVTSSQLQIANVTSAANHKDYVVVVTDGAGSVTSAPPATLTIIDSVPLLVNDTSITPSAAVCVGNNNIISINASFTGTGPISYQWQVSPNADGSGAVNVPGATSSAYTLSNPQVTDSGYYSLQAVNSLSTAPINSSWVQFSVSPASTALFRWSAPVPFGSLTANQILNGPAGTYFEAAAFGNLPSNVTVVQGGNTFLFTVDGSSASVTGGSGYNGVLSFTGDTGDANLNSILDHAYYEGTPLITLHNLTVGTLYSVQLFALDDVGGTTRPANFQDPNDVADVSRTFLMGDNVYVIGTFVANSTDVSLQENLPIGHGNLNAAVVRLAEPTVSLQPSGSSLQLSWNFGTLLESTNLTGPWITNLNTSPYTVTNNVPKKFYRVSYP